MQYQCTALKQSSLLKIKTCRVYIPITHVYILWIMETNDNILFFNSKISLNLNYLPRDNIMKVTRLFEDGNGQSHFEDVDIPLSDTEDIGRLSSVLQATGVIFRKTEGDYDFDWHPAPSRRLIVMLDGSVEITAGDGETRIFNTGDIVLAEDTQGRGHRSRAVDGKPRKSLFILLD